MANGLEDLHEKNKGPSVKEKNAHYDQWRTFQGREDAEMLQEKSSAWHSSKKRPGESDSWGDED